MVFRFQMTLGEVSAELLESEKILARSQAITAQRKLLPAFQYYDLILQTINANPITLIKGETGCGKSTQVRCVYTISY